MEIKKEIESKTISVFKKIFLVFAVIIFYTSF